jgi:hypothetical protein
VRVRLRCLGLVGYALVSAAHAGGVGSRARQHGDAASRPRLADSIVRDAARFVPVEGRPRLRLPEMKIRTQVVHMPRDQWQVGGRPALVEILSSEEEIAAINTSLQASAANRALREGAHLPHFFRAVSAGELNELLTKGYSRSPVAARWSRRDWRSFDESHLRQELTDYMRIMLGEIQLRFRAGRLRARLERALRGAARELPRQLLAAKTAREYTAILGERARRDPSFSMLLRAEHYLGGSGLFKVFKNFSDRGDAIPYRMGYDFVLEIGDVSGRGILTKLVRMPKGQSNEREVNFFDKLLLDEVISITPL